MGKAIVEEFAKLGAHVFTCCRTQDTLDSALSGWKERGWQVHGCTADVSTPDGRQSLLAAAEEAFGGVQLHSVCSLDSRPCMLLSP